MYPNKIQFTSERRQIEQVAGTTPTKTDAFEVKLKWSPLALSKKEVQNAPDMEIRSTQMSNNKTTTTMKNQSRKAAQTASIGNQDMMTFMPSPPSSGVQATTTTTTTTVHESSQPQQQQSTQNQNAMSVPHDINNKSGSDKAATPPIPSATPIDPTSAPPKLQPPPSTSSSSEVPNPLPSLRNIDRGDSMDDDAFNASLDALLKEAAGGDDDAAGGDVRFASQFVRGNSFEASYDASSYDGDGLLGPATSTTTTGTSQGGLMEEDMVGNTGQQRGRKRQLMGSEGVPVAFVGGTSRGATFVTETSSVTSESVAAVLASGPVVKKDGSNEDQPHSLHHHRQKPAAARREKGKQQGSGGALDKKQEKGAQGIALPQVAQSNQTTMMGNSSSINNGNACLPQPYYSARGIVQLPPMLLNSQPVSVSANGAGIPSGGKTAGDLFSGSPPLPQQQQLQFAAAPIATLPQHQIPTSLSCFGMPQQQPQQQAVTFAPGFIPLNTNGQLNSTTSPWDTTAVLASLQFPSQAMTSQAGMPSFDTSLGTLMKPIAPPNAASAAPAPVNTTVAQQPLSIPSNLTQMTGNLAPPVVKSNASVAASAVASRASSAASRQSYNTKSTAYSDSKRKWGSSLAVSEDESDKKKRRNERNLREQERSHRITDRIAELKGVLSEAGVHFKQDRYSTLVSVVNYIKQLQKRSQSLDEEHKKLLETIATADRLVNSNVNSGTTTVQTHMDALGENTSSSSNDDDEFLVFVQGIDYKFIFASCGVALAIASVDGRFVDCNEEFLRITDYTRKELLGEDDAEGKKGQGGTGNGGGGASGGVVTVSTSTSANSAALMSVASAAAVGGNASNGCTSHESRPPPEIHMRKPHLSLFNLLGREDMEAVYAAMSRMLRSSAPEHNSQRGGSNGNGSGKDESTMPRSSSSDSLTRSTEESSSGNEISGEGDKILRYTVDHWSGKVKHTRRKHEMVSSV